MICSKCGQNNSPDAKLCSYCENKLQHDSAEVELKSFTGKHINISEDFFSDDNKFDDSKFIDEKDNYVEEVYEESEKSPKSVKTIIDKISFEDGFEMDDMSLLNYGKNTVGKLISGNGKEALRNTALLAMGLAILIDIIIVICMMVYFNGFAERVVNIDQEFSERYDIIPNDIIEINGKNVKI